MSEGIDLDSQREREREREREHSEYICLGIGMYLPQTRVYPLAIVFAGLPEFWCACVLLCRLAAEAADRADLQACALPADCWIINKR